MSQTVCADERRFRNWLAGKSKAELDFACLLDRIWELLTLHTSESALEEGFHHLLVFLLRVRQTQDKLIRDLCHKTNSSHWDSLVERAGLLYERMLPQTAILAQKKAELDPASFHAYLYRVLENNLILCNKTVLAALLSEDAQVRKNEWLTNDDGLRDIELYDELTRPQRDFQTLSELLHDMDIAIQARDLLNSLLGDWDQARLNVLCHYLEIVAGRQSARLERESAANRDQLHHRVKNRFLDCLSRNDIDKEVARVFFTRHLDDLCQAVPPSPTYIGREENDDTHAE